MSCPTNIIRRHALENYDEITLALGYVREAAKLISESADRLTELDKNLGSSLCGEYASDIGERLYFLTAKIFDDLDNAQATADAWGAASGKDTSLSPLATQV